MSRCVKVLVADDEAIIQDVIEDILTNEGGAEVVGASTCEEALQWARDQAFDVVFVDVCLGDGDGVQLVRCIKEASPETRICMITGYRVEDQIADALAAGASGAIHKPFTVKELLATFSRLSTPANSVP